MESAWAMIPKDFHSALPASSQYTPSRLSTGRFCILSVPSSSGGPRRAGAALSGPETVTAAFPSDEASRGGVCP
jgi:hypothetical protein